MEKGPEIDWERSNVDHVLKHGFSVEEIETALGRPESTVVAKAGRDGTTQLFYQTYSGRYAFSPVTRTEDGRLCIHTTREMTEAERERYKKSHGGNYLYDRPLTEAERRERTDRTFLGDAFPPGLSRTDSGGASPDAGPRDEKVDSVDAEPTPPAS